VLSARRAGDDAVLANALIVQVLAAPTLERALSVADEAAPLCNRLGNVWHLTSLWANLAYRCLDSGEFDVADRSLRLARQAAMKAGQSGDIRLTLIDGNEGLLGLFRGDYATAAAAFCDELTRAQRYGSDRLLREGLQGVAAVLAATAGDPTTAARLWGAGEARSAQGQSAGISSRLDAILLRARTRLGDDSWATADADGRRLGRDEAVELALSAARSQAI
jgi:hypothetical protein